MDSKSTAGGAYQQAISDMIWLADLLSSSGDHLLIVDTGGDLSKALTVSRIVERIRFASIEIRRLSVWDFIFIALRHVAVFSLFQRVLYLRSSLEKFLLREGVDVIYFPTPSKIAYLLEEIPFAITVFDDCHRLFGEFPETYQDGEFDRREWFFRSIVARALLCVVSNADLAARLVSAGIVSVDRLLQLRFLPSTLLDFEIGASPEQPFDGRPYLLYPAQLWAHKNHGLIFRAIKLLGDEGLEVDLVLCGSDKGQGGELSSLAEQLGVKHRVHMRGFVSSDELATLYMGAAAMVMPSYFGPTNLPLLEAWKAQIPALYPAAFGEEAEGAALLFDYDDPASLADAIKSALRSEVRAEVVECGERRLRERTESRARAALVLGGTLDRLRWRLAPRALRPRKGHRSVPGIA